jgi:hypothetical protein
MKDDPTFSTYISHLRWSLASLPADERDDIVAEARSHLQEKLERGARIGETIDGLGAPKDYTDSRRMTVDYTARARLICDRDVATDEVRKGESGCASFAVSQRSWAIELLSLDL